MTLPDGYIINGIAHAPSNLYVPDEWRSGERRDRRIFEIEVRETD